MSAAPASLRPLPDLDRVLATACAEAGLPASARLLRHFANAVYLLDEVPVVARVGYGPDAGRKAATAVAVTRSLAARQFPVTEPAVLPSGARQPVLVPESGRDVAVSFWTYYPQPDGLGWPDTAVLGRIASELHDLGAVPVPLTDHRPLRSLHAALVETAPSRAFAEADRQWLLGRVTDLRTAYGELEFPLGQGVIHGDVYTGNLLWDTGAVVLGDWDSVCVGPRELDLIPTYHEPRFGVDPATVDAFAAAYGYDLRDWDGYQTLYDIRELSTLTALVRLAPTRPASARELAHRLDSLRNNRRSVTWHGQ